MIHLTKTRHKASKNDTKRQRENTEMPKLTQNPRKKDANICSKVLVAYSGFFSYTYEPRPQLLMHPLNHPVRLRVVHGGQNVLDAKRATKGRPG